MSNFMKKNFYKQREYFEKSAAVRDKKFSFPDGVVESRDIPYIADGQKEHLMDVYRPQGKENETLPVIINIHGGGLLIGNKEFNRYFCARLCLLGYVVFSVEYRLVPDCSVYDQFSDVSTAMTFIRDNLSSYEEIRIKSRGCRQRRCLSFNKCSCNDKEQENLPKLPTQRHLIFPRMPLDLSVVCFTQPALTKRSFPSFLFVWKGLTKRKQLHRM